MNHEWRFSAEKTFLARNEYGDGPEVYHCPLCSETMNLTGRDELATDGCSWQAVFGDLPCTPAADLSPKVDADGQLLIALWLDDERQSPPGWVRVRTVDDAITYLNLGVVSVMSLDHDLGCSYDEDPLKYTEAKTGYDLCKWMAENGVWPKHKPTVHSANPVGAANMKSIIDRYGPWCKETI